MKEVLILEDKSETRKVLAGLVKESAFGCRNL